MSMNDHSLDGRVVLITGAAHRLGAVTARVLHAAGANIIVHYNTSHEQARALRDALNARRDESAALLQGDLLHSATLGQVVEQATAAWGRLDVLVNNASTFYATPMGTVTEAHWEDLLGTNLKSPFFLSQAAAPQLAKQHGCIVNMVDVYADQPLKSFPVYSIAKAGLVMLTRTLARELAPAVRVNAVAPGTILWPENQSLSDTAKQRIIDQTLLKRQGDPEEIARAVRYLVSDATYTTGHVLTVDGGRGVHG